MKTKRPETVSDVRKMLVKLLKQAEKSRREFTSSDMRTSMNGEIRGLKDVLYRIDNDL